MTDLIEVRPDERFDVDRLVGWVAQDPSLPRGVPRVDQFGGGKANLTYLLTFPEGKELVLRRPPLGPVAASSHDMSREYRVLARLWEAFDKAPRAVAYCDDVTVLGARFFLMERKDGLVIRGDVPEDLGGGDDPDVNRALSEVVVDTLVEFHAVDPDRCGLGDLGRPEGFMRRQVEGWSRRWEEARHEENPLADELSSWLWSRMPDSGPPTLLHNDWRLDNMALAPDDPSRCVAVYDWDMATRGDPLADVGTLMGTWFDPGEAPEALGMMPTTSPGWLSRNAAVDRYGQKSGRFLDDIEWYLVFGAWKMAVVLQQIYIRWLRGQTQDERFRFLDVGVQHMLNLAAARR
ncbi:MAG: phosphotransferase family protein, partial [Acidimicrobiia bacterium]|nr:phosphotransferase family protein [Acidimicrobiia bacterium]